MVRRFLVLIAALLVAGEFATCGSRVAEAACRVRTKVVNAEVVASAVGATEVVAVPLAVSVGVPVATLAPYYYTYSAYAPGGSVAAIDLDALATKVVEKLRIAGPPPPPTPAPPNPPPAPDARTQATRELNARASLIEQRCAACHSGPDPKGKLSLENLATLDCPSRLKAIRAVLSEKMPKGGPRLTPEEAGQILEELVGP